MVYFLYIFLITVQWIASNCVYIKSSRITTGGVTAEGKKINNKLFLIVACVELIILAGIRGYNVGADASTYLSALEYYSSLPKGEILSAKLVYPFDFEVAYFMLTKICAFLGFSKTAFLFLIAIVTYVPIFIAINKLSVDPYLSILTYFAFGLFAYSLGIFRQMIAISIIICGIDFIKDRKFIKYALLVALAMTFHTSSVISIALYFIYPFAWKLNIKVALPAAAVSLVLGRPIISFVFNLFPSYSHYLNGKYDVQGGSYLMLLMYGVILAAYCIANHIKKPVGYSKIAFDAIAVSLVIQSLAYSMNIFGRIIGYYSVYLLFAIPNIINVFDTKTRQFIKLFVTVILWLLILWRVGSNSYINNYVVFWKQ